MQISRWLIYAVMLYSLLSGCSKNDADEESPVSSPNRLNLADLSLELDPKNGRPVLPEAVPLAVLETSNPSPVDMLDILTLALPIRRLAGVRLGDCDKLPPTEDSIAASGPVMVLKASYDLGGCVKREFEKDGYKIERSQLVSSWVIKLVCPEANFSGFDGRRVADFKQDEGMGVVSCKYVGGDAIKIQAHNQIDLAVSGEKASETPVTLSKQAFYALYGTRGECMINQSLGGDLSYKDCFLGSKLTKQHAIGEDTSRDVSFISRVDLSNQKSVKSAKSFAAGIKLPFVLSDWTGFVQIQGERRGDYVLEKDEAKVRGQIQFLD
jgi:hypothetical protein